MARPRLMLLAGLLCIGLAAIAANSAAASGADERYRFAVFLDDKPIGYHTFNVFKDGGSRVVESQARFNVKFLFVEVYQYLHHNREVWDGSCLRQIRAKTEDNGKSLYVRGERRAESFELATHTGNTTLPACVMTFSYWNPDFLDQPKLLNSQTGEYMDVRVAQEGTEQLRINDAMIEAKRYRLTARDVDITLWYDADTNQWVALQSRTVDGYLVRYEKLSPLRRVLTATSGHTESML